MTDSSLKISSLHDDLLWPKVSHERGLGEFRAEGVRYPIAERSPLCRTAQFGIDPDGLDFEHLSPRGAGYEHYGREIARGLERRYETVVAAIFDHYTLPGEPGPDESEMTRSVWAVAGHHDHLGGIPVQSGDDIVSGGVNVVLGIEGMDFVRSLATVNGLLERGVRVFGLQYNRGNALAEIETGLTRLGQEVVARLFAAKAILDLAHAPPSTRTQVLDFAESQGYGRQVTYSHGSTLLDAVPESAARTPHRFLMPEEVQRIVAMGGIVGLTPTRPFFPSLERLAERIDAICQLAGGAKSVALGTDFGGVWSGMLWPEIQSVADLWRIGEALSTRHNFTEEQVQCVLCKNATTWIRTALP